MDNKTLVQYYFIKRTFLFLDEWLFYAMLYKLMKSKFYKLWILVLLYGSGCIYTSYNNISMIERKIIDEEQKFFAIKLEIFHYFYDWIVRKNNHIAIQN